MRKELRFVLVGAFNTVAGYGVFAACYAIAMALDASYLYALVGSFAINVTMAFVNYKAFVFKTNGNLAAEYARFWGVYGLLFGVNLAVLPVLVAHGLHPLAAQAGVTFASAVVSYTAHNLFTFGTAA